MKQRHDWKRLSACLLIAFSAFQPAPSLAQNDAWRRQENMYRQQDVQRQQDQARRQQDMQRQQEADRERTRQRDAQFQRERQAQAERNKQSTPNRNGPQAATTAKNNDLQGRANARVKPNDTLTYANGITKRPLTAGEMRRGFTGKFTGDGRALIKFQGRVMAVPAARLGILPRQTYTSTAALTSKWTQKQQASVRQDIRQLVTVGTSSPPPGLKISRGNTPPISSTHNPQLLRITDASVARRYPHRHDYSDQFEAGKASFNLGYKEFSGKTDKDLYLVQYFDNKKPLDVENGRSVRWWTSVEQSEKIKSSRDLVGALSLPWHEPGAKPWDSRNTMQVARIPAGTEVRYAHGTARSQDSADYKIFTTGGGEQFMFDSFDSSWIIESETRPFPDGKN